MDIIGTLQKLALESGFAGFFMAGGWKNLVMILIAFVLLYLGIVKKYEPLLLVPIGMGVNATLCRGPRARRRQLFRRMDE